MDIINPKGLKTERISTEWCGRELTLEVNRVGFRTTSSVVVSYGDTTILGSVVVSKKPVEQDFFPLSIEYEEKFYAAGKMSGSKFIKREGKPSDNAVLVGRLIDRPIRPLFPKGYRQEVQVVATVLSMDPNFRPDCVAMVAASAALHCAGIPFDGPVAGVRIGKVDGKFKAFLTPEEREASDLDLVVAVRDGKVMMVEAGANEVPEEEIIEAMKWACENCKPALELQNKLREIVKPEELPYELTLPEESIQERVDKWCEPHFAGGKIRGNVLERQKICDELREQMDAELALELGEGENDEEKIADYEARLKKEYDEAFELAVHHEVRRGIVEEGVRPDGRKLTEVRPLSSQVSVLPRVHGSSLFTRGLTQAMNIVTLAPMSFAQVVDTMEVTDGIRRYIHHYNAAPFTVGEIGRIGSPGRREIGHGYLAERALMPVLPGVEDFPYAIRSVTEIMSQNGSTSMAATCSSCLALMDAGVPLKRPVSGVAMGLMVDVPKGHDITAADIDKAYVLTDLMDAEDFAGDMDFKSLNPLKHLKNTIVLFIPQVAIQVYTVLDKTMIGAIITDKSEVGYYEQSQKLVKVLLAVVTSLGIVMASRIAKYYAAGKKRETEKAMYKSFRVVFLMGMPIMAGLMVTAPTFSPLFYGEGYDAIPLLLRIISPILIFIGMSNVIGIQYLLPTKKQTEYTASVISGAAVNFIANLILIPKLGAVGASIGTVIAELTTTAAQLYFIRKDFQISKILFSSFIYIFASIVMVAVCLLIGNFATVPFYKLIAQVVVGALSYGLVLVIFREPLILEFISKIKSKLRNSNN